MKITKTLLSATMAAALIGGAAIAQTTTPTTPSETPKAENRAGKRLGKKMHGKRMMRGQRIAAALNLTDVQKQQLKELRAKQRAATEDERAQVRTLRSQLREATKAGNTAQIQTLSEQLGAAQGKLRTARSSARDDFRSVLTPEQQQKLQELRQERMNRFQNRHAGAANRG